MNNSSPLLSLENLSVEFSSKEQNFQAVKKLNLKIYPGEFVALVGESGSGKTITSLSIMNLLPENARINGGTINATGGEDGKIGYRELVLALGASGSISAGTNLVIVDAPAASKTSYCIVRWDGVTAKLYVWESED